MRAFIAIDVSEEVKKRAEALEKEFQIDGLTPVKKDAMHITLQFLGEMSADDAVKVGRAMQRVRMRPFKIELSGVSYFTPRLIKVIFVKLSLGEREISNLYAQLEKALLADGVKFEKESDYRPHLTIARVKRVKQMRLLRDALEKTSEFKLGSCEIRSISLKESTLTPDGPVYRELYELKL